MQEVLNRKKINTIEEETKHSNKLLSKIKDTYYNVYKFFSNSYFLGCLKKTIVMTLPIIVLGVIFSIIFLIITFL